MIKAIIIDDEPLAVEFVKEQLRTFPQIEVVAECANGFEGAKAISLHHPDLIFLDIQMPKITGFEMLELLEEPPAVIFITAFDEFAVQAFEKHAVDYLLKPVDPSRFRKAVEKFLNDSGQTQKSATSEFLSSYSEKLNRLVVKDGSNIRIIPVDEILYIEAYDDYVKINTAKDCYLKKATMGKLESSLDPELFVRVHRSFIIRIPEITRIENSGKDSYLALLRSGEKIPLSKSGYPKLKQVLGI